MSKSSINFAKAKVHSEAHNFRKDKPSYLLPEEHQQKNDYWKCEIDERTIFKKSAEQQRTGKKPVFENSLWEAVVNFNHGHTLEDMQKVAKHIEKKFNITCSRIAMHRDEGHINERGIVEYNLHAHINFVTHKDGKQNWRQSLVRSKLTDLQTEVAEILNMERGISKEITGAVSLNHKLYREHIRRVNTHAKEQEQTLATQKELKEEVAKLRAELKEAGATRAEYAQLEQKNKELLAELRENRLTIVRLKSSLQTKELEKDLGAILNAEKPKDDPRVEKLNKIDSKAVSELLNTSFKEDIFYLTTKDNRDNAKIAQEALKESIVTVEKKGFLTTTTTTKLEQNMLLAKFEKELNKKDEIIASLVKERDFFKKMYEKTKEVFNNLKDKIKPLFIQERTRERERTREQEQTLQQNQNRNRGMSR